MIDRACKKKVWARSTLNLLYTRLEHNTSHIIYFSNAYRPKKKKKMPTIPILFRTLIEKATLKNHNEQISTDKFYCRPFVVFFFFKD